MPNLNSLIEAERAFSRMASSDGIRKAFLTFLADDGVIFRPQPVVGKEWYEKHPEIEAYLKWEPVIADVALSGDFGYTTGPWEYRKNPTEDPLACGHYVSVWKFNAEGKWRVVADISVECSPPVALRKAPFSDAPQGKPLPARAIQTRQEALIKCEKDFMAAAFNDGASKALNSYADEGMLAFRTDSAPLPKQQALRTLGGSRIKMISGEVAFSDVSPSGDLGYAFGKTSCLIRNKNDLTLHYLRVWQGHENSDWKLVIDVAN